ncbi:MAG TPA: phenylalanine 4-monooxygenase [Gemmatimonadaceae bacterium]|nr:phenylalanine 4-monooxygenase [Gemmatimonadaceae bacterium]
MSIEADVEIVSSSTERVTQDWDRYTSADHQVWQILYARRMEQLQSTASAIFLNGAELIGLAPHEVPDLEDVNRRLGARTGWNAVPVGGFLPAKEFFASLSMRRFPTTVTIRSRDSIDYVPEPDIFHDVFGHVPLHSDPSFADFLQRFGQAATMARTPEEVEMMARLFWFTIEFGLIDENGTPKIYGSGLISSAGDAANALGPSCDRRPFSLDGVISQSFRIDQLQDTLFVVDAFDQLYDAVDVVAGRLAN